MFLIVPGDIDAILDADELDFEQDDVSPPHVSPRAVQYLVQARSPQRQQVGMWAWSVVR